MEKISTSKFLGLILQYIPRMYCDTRREWMGDQTNFLALVNCHRIHFLASKYNSTILVSCSE